MKLALRIVLFCFPLVFAGCVDIEHYYQYPRDYAESVMKNKGIPITEKEKSMIESLKLYSQVTTIRYKLNQTNKPSLIIWYFVETENLKLSKADTDIIANLPKIDSREFSYCKVLDKNNWECERSVDERAAMIAGELRLNDIPLTTKRGLIINGQKISLL